MWAEILWDLRLFPGGSDGKVSVYNMRDLGLIPGLGRFPGEGNNNPLQSSCLENPMDRGPWCRLLSIGWQRVRHDWATSLLSQQVIQKDDAVKGQTDNPELNWKPLKIPENLLTVKTELGLKVKMLTDNWVHAYLFISWWKYKHLQTRWQVTYERNKTKAGIWLLQNSRTGPSCHSHWKIQSATNKYTFFRKAPLVLSFSVYDQHINQNKEFNSRGCLWE